MVSTLTRIAIPILGPTMDEALRDMYEITERDYATKFPVEVILELRLDYMLNPDVERLVDGSPLPKIGTNRVQSEAGSDPNAGFKGSEDERYAYLQKTANYGVEYVDSEWRYPGHLQLGPKARPIHSYHNFTETPLNLEEIYRGIKADTSEDTIIKIATKANSEQDNERMFRLIEHARSEGRDIIALCMGLLGIPTRIRGSSLGSYLTFASLKRGKESAPAQPTIDELVHNPDFFKMPSF